MLLPRDTSSNGTVAVIVFIAGAIILVLTIILVLLYFKKRRSARAREARMVSGKEFLPHRKVGRYGKLEEDDEQAWSAEMEAGHGEGERERERGGYAPVHDEGMEYQSQTMHFGAGREGRSDDALR